MEEWNVYLSGEIHTEWRQDLVEKSEERQLPVQFFAPELDHELSDACGTQILGAEDNAFWRDHKSAKINSIRTRTLLSAADIVVVKFGDKYRQWNAAFEAGAAVTMQKPLVVLHDPELTHALKEIDACAAAVAHDLEQVVDVLGYVMGMTA